MSVDEVGLRGDLRACCPWLCTRCGAWWRWRWGGPPCTPPCGSPTALPAGVFVPPPMLLLLLWPSVLRCRIQADTAAWPPALLCRGPPEAPVLVAERGVPAIEDPAMPEAGDAMPCMPEGEIPGSESKCLRASGLLWLAAELRGVGPIEEGVGRCMLAAWWSTVDSAPLAGSMTSLRLVSLSWRGPRGGSQWENDPLLRWLSSTQPKSKGRRARLVEAARLARSWGMGPEAMRSTMVVKELPAWPMLKLPWPPERRDEGPPELGPAWC